MIAEAVAIRDLVCSLPHNLKKIITTIPILQTIYRIREIQDTPLLERYYKFCPNTISSTKQAPAYKSTGCNMSGKSVYLNKFPYLHNPQMGSGIPALYGSFLSLNVYMQESAMTVWELTSSNFGFEMKEMAYFLDDINTETLLILDELGRGSSIADGFCVSLAVTEHLLRTEATVFLSTHFQDIPKIMSKKPAVSHLHMDAVLLNDNSVKMNYQLTQKSVAIENSGIRVAKYSTRILCRSVHISIRFENCKSKRLKRRFKWALLIKRP
ncbi:CBM_collapsed_G0020740.mRNA.1.CDS.1 [Saccharomyces cerevisiae]|nr:CBM_collapsed_G0020740.mRNA.1.CDS.1 [Saccharomyces cerevisiae]